mgnify:FL=1
MKIQIPQRGESGYTIPNIPSPHTGAPVRADLVWSTANPKTGPGWQLFILDQQNHPSEALKTGGDASVCGNCPMRPRTDLPGLPRYRGCYVNPAMLGAVWKKQRKAFSSSSDTTKVLQGHYLRLGAYGDPAMLPTPLLELLTRSCSNWTGYTHQHNEPWYNPEANKYLMHSVETIAQAKESWAKGARTFRIDLEELGAQPGEVVCPNVTHGVQCRDCNLCRGNSLGNAKSVCIPPHGAQGQEKNLKLILEVK